LLELLNSSQRTSTLRWIFVMPIIYVGHICMT